MQQNNPRSFWYCTRENLMHFCEISSKFSFYCFVHTLISFHYIYWLLNFKLNKLTFENEFFFAIRIVSNIFYYSVKKACAGSWSISGFTISLIFFAKRVLSMKNVCYEFYFALSLLLNMIRSIAYCLETRNSSLKWY